ncbi:hypothetical protein CLAFUW4_04167 [Fulvia fulva]|uniref:Uncharacterized protein n=1 Tax=Passalora fulva TaxID=5499 RepID=A0A9Q8P7M7_PASFU|nr:uncharacterized protein CLAFUR5_04130 [Fulvia fulva]KAK4627360.1 hypothetical protein CLAFUR4_04153 [Fulvia fulva]KAK4628651.1 hypothetical protein CLAFUR0_04154 [Fulvia fulva]UJO16201.1 hypothetical protein CLAFUR5_04130 [Fulvia fulva]WPV13951.1 hypothetical protein CLAFUW4_04167 [Fulvia fulva]WPV29246.1 hypothetical protein CLAFUW7_04156 [Fulvia fulva]
MLLDFTPSFQSRQHTHYAFPDPNRLLAAKVSAQVPAILAQATTTPGLNITALDAIDGSSILQCWQLDPFTVSSTPGTVGEASNVSYTVIPPRTNAGLHVAPAAQFVVFLSGLIHLTLPNSTDEAWVVGGKYGMILAGDTADVLGIGGNVLTIDLCVLGTFGHNTEYPGNEATVAVQVPLAPGMKLNHTVLQEVGCGFEDYVGL